MKDINIRISLENSDHFCPVWCATIIQRDIIFSWDGIKFSWSKFFLRQRKNPIGAILIRCKTISLPHTIRQFSPFQIVIKMQRKHERFINSFKLGKASKPFILLKTSFNYFLFCGTRLFKQNNYVSQITKQLHITARGHINGSNINLS